jgi:hypothetical protein
VPDIDFAGWAQALVALCALLLAPKSIARLWERLRYRVEVRATAQSFDRNGNSKRWRLEVDNTSGKLRSINFEIYPTGSRNRVKFHRRNSINDAGLEAFVSMNEGGYLEVDAYRIGVDRLLEFEVSFIYPAQPVVHFRGEPAKVSFVWPRENSAAYKAYQTLVAKTRLIMLALQFAALAIAIEVKIVMLLLWG